MVIFLKHIASRMQPCPHSPGLLVNQRRCFTLSRRVANFLPQKDPRQITEMAKNTNKNGVKKRFRIFTTQKKRQKPIEHASVTIWKSLTWVTLKITFN